MSTEKSNIANQDWPKSSDFKKSIRTEFTLYVSAVAVAMMLMTGYIMSSLYVDTVTRGIIDKMLVQARAYSSPAGKLIIGSTSPDALLLSNTCKQLANTNQGVYWAGISGSDGTFIAHTDMKQVLAGAKASTLQTDDYADLTEDDEGIQLSNDTIYISVPIVENNVKVGALSVAASAEPVRAARRSSVLLILIITLAVIAIGVPLTWIVLHRKLHPLGLIVDSLRKIDPEHPRIEINLKRKNELAYLAETLNTMGDKLSIAQKELIEKQRIARELEIAKEIQDSILPRSFPEAEHFSIAGTYRSAMEVGGDYYDFMHFDDDHLGIIVADVSGKSLPGMLVMLMTRDIIKRVARYYRPPREILIDVNSELRESIRKGMFVTMFLGVLSTKTGKLEFASAGHNPILHYSSTTRKARFIKTNGFPLGMMPETTFAKRLEQSELQLKRDDIILQYTDGVNEALNVAEEEYGLDRFAGFVMKHGESDPEKLIDRLIADLEEFVGDADQYDDITLLALKWAALTTDNTNNQGRMLKHAASSEVKT